MTRIAGIDGCRSGWVRVERTGSSRLGIAIVSTTQLISEATTFSVLAIDIPIGLPDGGSREVDRCARRLLGAPRASSVFPAPVRAALEATTYDDACSRSFDACGKRLSKQAFAILPKIREIDRALLASPRAAEVVREVHPEVCFYFMNGMASMAHSKKKRAGLDERVLLLERYFGAVFADLRAALPRREASSDDIADALVALWSAERVRDGSNVALAGAITRDSRGLRMEMVA